jgi:hypothetical protein
MHRAKYKVFIGGGWRSRGRRRTMIKANGIEFTYNGNGWSFRREGEKLAGGCCVNDRFGDGESIITMSGKILATLGKAEIAAEIAAWNADREVRRSAEAPARSAVRAPRTRYVGGDEDYGGDWQRNGRGQWVR